MEIWWSQLSVFPHTLTSLDVTHCALLSPPPPLPPALLLKIVTTSPPFSNSPWFIFWFWLGRGWITLYFLAQGRAEGVHTNAFAVPNQSPDSAEPSRYAAENQAATPTTGCKNPVHRWGDIQIYLGSNLSWLWWKLPLNAFLGQLMRLARIFGACNDPWHITPWECFSADWHMPPRMVIMIEVTPLGKTAENFQSPVWVVL